jgi:hypothetical protein
VRAIADRAAALPLALVVTTRPLPAGSWVRHRLDDLDATALRLGPLTSAEVDLLALEVLGEAPGPQLLAALEAAAGNPLLVLAVLDAGAGAEGQGAHGGEPAQRCSAAARRVRARCGAGRSPVPAARFAELLISEGRWDRLAQHFGDDPDKPRP